VRPPSRNPTARRADVQRRKGAGKDIELKELGPRFDMKLYQIKQGTIEQQVLTNAPFALQSHWNSAALTGS
jgi:U3 small nucleolar ribonucleoprotein protein IMP4